MFAGSILDVCAEGFFFEMIEKETRQGCAAHYRVSDRLPPLLLPLTLALRNGDAPSYLFAYWPVLRIGQGRIASKETNSLFKFAVY